MTAMRWKDDYTYRVGIVVLLENVVCIEKAGIEAPGWLKIVRGELLDLWPFPGPTAFRSCDRLAGPKRHSTQRESEIYNPKVL